MKSQHNEHAVCVLLKRRMRVSRKHHSEQPAKYLYCTPKREKWQLNMWNNNLCRNDDIPMRWFVSIERFGTIHGTLIYIHFTKRNALFRCVCVFSMKQIAFTCFAFSFSCNTPTYAFTLKWVGASPCPCNITVCKSPNWYLFVISVTAQRQNLPDLSDTSNKPILAQVGEDINIDCVIKNRNNLTVLWKYVNGSVETLLAANHVIVSDDKRLSVITESSM